MRVLATIIVPPHLMASGGARAGELLSRALSRHCDMTVASMLPGEGETGETTHRAVVRTSLPFYLASERVPRRYRSLFYRSDIPRLIRGGHYDLVHIHNPMPALEMARVAAACRSSSIPFVVSTHGFNEVVNGLKIYSFNPLQKTIWSQLVVAPVRRAIIGAAEIFALSPHDLELIRALGGEADNIRIVSNGVPEAPTAHRGEDDLILKRLGISPRADSAPPTYMFLANHTPNKGLPILLEAFGRLRSPFTLIVAGETREGIDYDRATRSSGTGQRIVVTGRLSDAEVNACFRRADVFVFPTLADTFPLVVLEAMTHGKAVIASQVGGIPHQLNGGCGLLVPAGDVGKLVEAIVRLGRDPVLAEQMGRAGRRKTQVSFTWESAAESAIAGYEHILCSKVSHKHRQPPLKRLHPSSPDLAEDW